MPGAPLSSRIICDRIIKPSIQAHIMQAAWFAALGQEDAAQQHRVAANYGHVYGSRG